MSQELRKWVHIPSGNSICREGQRSKKGIGYEEN